MTLHVITLCASLIVRPPTSAFLRHQRHPRSLVVTSNLAFEVSDKGAVSISSTSSGTVVLEGVCPSLTPQRTQGGGFFLNARFPSSASAHVATLGCLRSCTRFVAAARVTRYWMGPAFGKTERDVPHDTQFLLVEQDAGNEYALLLPLIDVNSGMRASLHGRPARDRCDEFSCSDPGDELILHVESGDSAVTSAVVRPALYVATGSDPYELLARGFAEVSEKLQTFRVRTAKTLPPSVDWFGWCTWDAFYSSVEPRGVYEGLQTLCDAGVPPRTLILDDGWQQVTPSKPLHKPPSDAPAAKGAGGGGGEGLSAVTASPAAAPLAALRAAATAIVAWVGGRLLAAISAVFERFYERFVRRAPHGSWATRVWRGLTRTALKPSLWSYFDTETDFGRQLDGFEPNAKFERGEDGQHSLSSLVSAVKSELGVHYVYCWHALHGYWRGASTALGKAHDVPIMQVTPEPSRHLLTLEPQVAWDTPAVFGVGLCTTREGCDRLYDELHAPLVAAGVDGVKIDVQSGVPAMGGGIGGGTRIAAAYMRAMEASVAKRFGVAAVGTSGAKECDAGAAEGAHCINCMCHSTDNLYQYQTTAVARASDDFYPRRPESHTVHIVNVAYNSLFLGELALPDWDMFHSSHAVAGLHAAARAVGGCPVYVSDAPGLHDVPLLRSLVMRDGRVLRAQLPGRPTRDSLFADVGTDGTTALKVWNANAVGGIVGAFHVQGVAWDWRTHENVVLESEPPPLEASVRPHDVETLRASAADGAFAVWRHRGARVEVADRLASAVHVQLRAREWEVFTIVPMQRSGVVSWAPLGLGNMINAGGALIAAAELTQGSAAMIATVSCRSPGQFVAYARPGPTRVLRSAVGQGHDGGAGAVAASFAHDARTGKLEVMLPDDGVTELTVEW